MYHHATIGSYSPDRLKNKVLPYHSFTIDSSIDRSFIHSFIHSFIRFLMIFVLSAVNSFNINVSNANGLNALHLASKEGHLDIVNMLLDRSAFVDASTARGNTALHIASLAGEHTRASTFILSCLIVRFLVCWNFVRT